MLGRGGAKWAKAGDEKSTPLIYSISSFLRCYLGLSNTCLRESSICTSRLSGLVLVMPGVGPKSFLLGLFFDCLLAKAHATFHVFQGRA